MRDEELDLVGDDRFEPGFEVRLEVRAVVGADLTAGMRRAASSATSNGVTTSRSAICTNVGAVMAFARRPGE